MRLHVSWLVSVISVGCAPPPELGPSADDLGAAADDGTSEDTDDPSDGSGAALDPARLDRSVDEGRCGFPGPGPGGYGSKVGERLANNAGLRLVDCEGREVELADFLCERENGRHNAGVLVNIGAGWCGPCQSETLEFPELYAEYHDRGIELVQVLFQDWSAQAPTQGFCRDWSVGNWRVGDGTQSQDVGVEIGFPVLLDQVNDWTSIYLQDPQSATPVNMLIDANGNIRWKTEGQLPDPEVLRTQFELVLADPYGDR